MVEARAKNPITSLRRRLTARATVVLSAVLLAAFMAFGPAAAQGDPVVVRMWFGRQDFIPGDAFDQFHAENPNIRVETDVIPLEQAPADFIRNYRAGNEPDIFQVHAERATVLAVQGALYDMSDLFDQWRAEDPDSYNELASVAFTSPAYGDGVYGLGVHVGPKWMVYRKDLFEQAGLGVPQTFDDILEAARTLTGPDMIGYSLIGDRNAYNWIMQLFVPLGGEIVDGIPEIDSEAGRYLFDFYQTLIREELVDRETVSWAPGDARAAFIGGRAAMMFEGDNVYAAINEALEFDVEWAAMPVPPRPGAEDSNLQLANAWPYYVSANTENPEAVLKVLQYVARPEIVGEVAMRYQPTTSLPVINSDEYAAAKPWMPSLADAFAGVVLADPPGHPRFQEVMDIVLDAYQEALQNPNSDTAALLERTQERLDALR